MGENDWEHYFAKYSVLWPEIVGTDSRSTNSGSLIQQAEAETKKKATERQYKFVGKGLCSLCGIHANLIYAPSVSAPRSIWDFSSVSDNQEKVCRTCYDMADAIQKNSFMVAVQKDFERERNHRRKLINGEL